MTMTVTASKSCTKCGTVKPLDEFYGDRTGKDGRRSDCKACIRGAQSAYRADNPEYHRARHAAYREANPEYRRAYHAANREHRNAASRAWRASNPSSYWEASYRERAERFGFVPVIESFTRSDLIALYGDACAHCDGPFEELDHYPVPVAHGGHHTLTNARPSCTPCNRSQGASIAHQCQENQ